MYVCVCVCVCLVRWRQESKNMTEKFEETITSLRNEVTSYRTKNEVLIIEMNSFVKQKEKVCLPLSFSVSIIIIILVYSNHNI